MGGLLLLLLLVGVVERCRGEGCGGVRGGERGRWVGGDGRGDFAAPDEDALLFGRGHERVVGLHGGDGVW